MVGPPLRAFATTTGRRVTISGLSGRGRNLINRDGPELLHERALRRPRDVVAVRVPGQVAGLQIILLAGLVVADVDLPLEQDDRLVTQWRGVRNGADTIDVATVDPFTGAPDPAHHGPRRPGLLDEKQLTAVLRPLGFLPAERQPITGIVVDVGEGEFVRWGGGLGTVPDDPVLLEEWRLGLPEQFDALRVA